LLFFYPLSYFTLTVEDYLSGRKGESKICSELQISRSSFEDWLRIYRDQGSQGLSILSRNGYYPESLKLQAVLDYKNGVGSQNQICSKYNISTQPLLRKWIKKYNDHETFKSRNMPGDKCMIKGRKTTYEERVEIVAFCIANDDNYQATSEQFQVSYQQVYTWVKKYKEKGHDSLLDRRGKRKSPEEMTEQEKYAAQLKLLESENKRLRMENAFLKKLDEVERWREKVEHIKKTDI
jgi:transposase-like protein